MKKRNQRMFFSDRIDVTATISLYEYSLLRRPIDGKTLFCENPSSEEHTMGNPPRIKVFYIDLNDVTDWLDSMPKGFFDSISQTKEGVLSDLHKDNLTWIICCMEQYRGILSEQLYDY